MINPSDPLFPHSFNKQSQLQEIQDDINLIIAEVQWGFYEEVKASSGASVDNFENLANAINALHAPILADFTELDPSSCRDGAETLINVTRTQTGFHAGNCASRLYNAVTAHVAKIGSLFENFNAQFSEIQQIVVKSFIQSNLFVDMPTDVMNKMDAKYELVKTRWDAQKPSFVALRAQLKKDLDEEIEKLQVCQSESTTLATTLYNMVRGQIDVCIEFNQNGNARARAGPASSRNFVAEAMNYLANHQFEFPYVV